MRVTVLAENTSASPHLPAEHGLSLWLETADLRILFDMGQSDLFAQNAERLGIDLASADLAVLSHGHYDHAGGLRRFLALNDHAPVYVSRHAFGRFRNASGRYIGMDPALQGHPRLILTDEETTLGEGLLLRHCNSLPRPQSLGAFGLTAEQNGVLAEDPFLHEQYLLIREGARRILVSGCSHKGIFDILSWFQPHVFIGGLHLSKLEPGRELDPIAHKLAQQPTLFYTCHCTGTEQYKYMKGTVPRMEYLSTGDTIWI